MGQIARLHPRAFDHGLIARDIGIQVLDQRRDFGRIGTFEAGAGAFAQLPDGGGQSVERRRPNRTTA
jgi:hypothetical protein